MRRADRSRVAGRRPDLGALAGDLSVEKSQRLNERILEAMALRDRIAYPRGAERAMSGKDTPVDSPAVRHIIAGGPDGKLYVVALGAATNLASALLLDPEIEDKVVIAR